MNYRNKGKGRRRNRVSRKKNNGLLFVSERCSTFCLIFTCLDTQWSSLETHLHLMSVFPARDLPGMSLTSVDCKKQGGETNTIVMEPLHCSIWHSSGFQDPFDLSHRWFGECVLETWLLEHLELPKTSYLKIKMLYLPVKMKNIYEFWTLIVWMVHLHSLGTYQFWGFLLEF